MLKLLGELKENLIKFLKEEKGGVMVLEVTINNGGIRGWNFFKKLKLKD